MSADAPGQLLRTILATLNSAGVPHLVVRIVRQHCVWRAPDYS